MHCSRRQGVRGRLGRVGVSPLLRHSPVRAPPPDDNCDPESAIPLPIPKHGPHEVCVDQWPRDLHELEMAALFHKYSIYPTHIHLHRRQMSDGYAFVELSCAEDVARAVDQLHGGKVMGHQIVVQRSRGSRRPRTEPRPTMLDDDVVLDYDEEIKEEELAEDDEEPEVQEVCREVQVVCRSPPPARPCSPVMPPLVLPGPGITSIRRRLGDRDAEMYESLMRAKRVCTGRAGGGYFSPGDSGDSGQLHDLTQDSGSGQQSGRSSTTYMSVAPAATPLGVAARYGGVGGGGAVSASSEVIRHRLHQPVDVLVANFPAHTAELDLMDLFSRYKPLRVRVMVSDPGLQQEDFTYAYVTVWNTMMADSAVMGLDGRRFRGRDLVVEVRRSS